MVYQGAPNYAVYRAREHSQAKQHSIVWEFTPTHIRWTCRCCSADGSARYVYPERQVVHGSTGN